ncbi:MAG: YigZ family protein [Treponemataceae bacterium]
MNILSAYAKAEIIIQKSRFINEAFVVESQNEARQQLKAQKEIYFDANHVVHAFCVGLQGEVLGCSDDGEPSGTAGRPMLEVLKGKKITNILVTSARYFGGTLLGTGGLVKAYTESAQSVLNICQIEKYIKKRDFSFVIEYPQYEIIKRTIETFQAEIIHEDFLETIAIKTSLPVEQYEPFCQMLIETTNAKVKILDL